MESLDFSDLKAVYVNCTLKKSPEISHTDTLMEVSKNIMMGWIGEVGPGPSYGDKEWNEEKLEKPVGFDSQFTNRNIIFMTYNRLHLASMLKANKGYSSYGNSRVAWDKGSRWGFEILRNNPG